MATLVCAAGLGACGPPPRPVPLVGGSADIAALAGEWEGEYSSAEAGRTGSIVFHLRAGADTAHGDVVMDPPAWRRAFRPTERAVTPEPLIQAPQVLTINFVRVGGGRVSGTLAPYQAPDCGCTLLTTFDGRLKDDTLGGTFTSRHRETGDVQTGRWKVTRKPRQ